MKLTKCKILLWGISLLLITTLSVSCALVKSTTTQNINIQAGQYTSIPVTLNSGDLIEGSFTVSGPTDLDIKFSVQNPTGTSVFGPTRSRSGSFSYRAQTTGVHYLYLDNTYSLFTGKIVSLS